jgi:hypothetical protein
MNSKVILITVLIFTSSTLFANPLVVAVVKEGAKQIIKKAPKVIKTIAPLLPIADLVAEEVKEKMSKKKLDLLKTKF